MKILRRLAVFLIVTLFLACAVLRFFVWGIEFIGQRPQWLQKQFPEVIKEIDIGAIETGWSGMNLWLKAENIHLVAGASLQWSLAVEQITLNARLSDNNFSFIDVRGLDIRGQRVSEQALKWQPNWDDIQTWLDWLPRLASINGRAMWRLDDGQWLKVNHIDISWNLNPADDIFFALNMIPDEKKDQEINLHVQNGAKNGGYWNFRVDPGDYSHLFHALNFELTTGMALSGYWRPDGVNASGSLSPTKLFWNDLQKDSRLHIAIPEVEMYVTGVPDDWHIGIHVGDVVFNGHTLQVGDLAFSWAETGLRLQLQQIDIANGAKGLVDSGLLPEQVAIGLTKIGLQGALAPVILTWDFNSNWRDIGFYAQLNELHMQGWRAVPHITGVDAKLDGTLGSGLIHLQSDNMGLGLLNMFKEVWEIPNVNMLLGWKLQNEYVRFLSTPSCLKYQVGNVCLEIGIRMPYANLQDIQLGLKVGILEGYGKYKSLFLPSTPKTRTLSQWLEQYSDVEKASGIILFEGQPSAIHGNPAKLFSLMLNIGNGSLRVIPGKEPIENIAGTVLVDMYKGQVQVDVERATLRDVIIQEGSATVQVGKEGLFEAPVLQIQAIADVAAEKVADIVSNFSVDPKLEALFSEQLQLSGPTHARVGVSWPIGKPVNELQLNVEIQLKGVDLSFTDTDLFFEGLQGALHYNSSTFLSTNGLSASFMGGSINLSATEHPGYSNFAYRGSMPATEVLSYIGFPGIFITQVGGQVSYQGSMSFGVDRDSMEISAEAKLDGISSNLPAPFDFSSQPENEMLFNASIPTNGEERKITFDLPKVWKGQLFYRNDDENMRGEIYLGGSEELGAGPTSGFWIRGRMDDLNPLDWLSLYAPTSSSAPNINFDLEAEQVEIIGIKAGAIHLFREDEQELYFSGDYLDGYIDTTVGELVFENLHWQDGWKEQVAWERDDAFSMGSEKEGYKVHINQFWIEEQEQPLAISFGIATRNDGYAINFLQLQGYGVSLDTDERNEYSYVQGMSQLHLAMRVNNFDYFADIFDRAGLQAKNAKLQASVQWQGELDDVMSIDILDKWNGHLDIEVNKGRIEATRGSAFMFKVLSVLNLNQLLRNIVRFNFAWLFKRSFEYDEASARILLSPGKVQFEGKGLKVSSPSGLGYLTGNVTRGDGWEQARLDLNGSLEVDIARSAPWYIAAATGSWAYASVAWLIRKIFRKNIENYRILQFAVAGTIDSPVVQQVKKSAVKNRSQSEERQESDNIGNGG